MSREELLFQLALTKPAEERGAWLDRECGGDLVLRARLGALIAAHEQSAPQCGETTETTLKPGADLQELDRAIGQTIGRYKLLEKVGEGGCGVVYVAEQSEPVRRRVALKVIKLGMDTKQVVARFEAERQALAMMDHPNIAKVLDAGATETGRPYFVMELVRGIRITDYCDQNNLTTKERLELFIPVCQAIQHAHQKGIIHRDIKPSNILVTLHDGVAVPKVIDFGIAKATEGRLTDATVYTQLHQFIGTPAYMSPEQAEMSGLDVDTRSDIYSLGVLLYELLTGKTPFDEKELMSQGIDSMRKTIREKDPVRPSTRLANLKGEDLTTTAKRRSIETTKLAHQLRGDLDWIVMKCLEKDRKRRYETANGLAADLKRHLNDEAIAARPASKLYRMQKVIRRNRLACTAAVLVALALITGTVVSLWQAVRARRAEALALQTRSDAEEFSNFVIEDLYEELQPISRLETVAKLAAKAVEYYDRLPPGLRTPETERNHALARARLALIFSMQGDVKTALPMATSVVPQFEQWRKAGDRSGATLFGLGLALFAQSQGYLAQADPGPGITAARRAVEVLKPSAISPDGPRRVKLLYCRLLNDVAFSQSPEQSIATLEEALRVLASLGALDLSDLSAASLWADTADTEARRALHMGRLDDAERLENQTVDLAERILTHRPGDLQASCDRVEGLELLVDLALEQNHDAPALQLSERAQRAAEDYVHINPSEEKGWFLLDSVDYHSAAVQFHLGHPVQALERARAVLARPPQADSTNSILSSPYLLRAAVARWEAQLGERAMAEEALLEARRDVDAFCNRRRAPELSSVLYDETVEASVRRVRLAFGEDAAALTMAQSALARLEKVKPDLAYPNDSGAALNPVWLHREAWALEDLAQAALNLRRYSEAEAAARTLGGLQSELEANRAYLLSPVGFFDPDWGQVLLSQAELGLNRREETLKTTEMTLDHYRRLQAQGANHLLFRQHFARALYVHALGQPANETGRAQRRDSLDQAARLLHDLPEQAQQLHDTKELLSWIEAARKQTNQDGQTK